METTDEQIIETSRAMACAFLDTAARGGLSPDDVATLAGAALGEVLAQQLGPFGAVNRLRDMADVFERQLLEGCEPK